MPSSVDALALNELVPPPGEGRLFERAFQAGFADCAPSGRIRLDTVARWLQDVAYADVVDADLVTEAAWVVRRTRIRVRRFPRFGETCVLSTFCSGLGRMWAERRTSVSVGGQGETDIEAVTIWIHLNRTSGRPVPVSDEEALLWGASTAGRRVKARLRHPSPSWQEHRSSWNFRATELDMAEHINNAAYWEPLEEELLSGEELESVDAELEYRTPAQPGEKVILRDGIRRWIVGEDGEIHASILLAELTPLSGA
jgi:acyl-ACP thioesterase